MINRQPGPPTPPSFNRQPALAEVTAIDMGIVADTFLTCPRCQRRLGVEVAGVHVMHHAQRVVVGRFLSAKCKCGGLWESAELAALKHLLDTMAPTPITAAVRAVIDTEAA